jgi:peptidoglycan hydrolase-like protein with peptidoglycan-binding domain
MRPFTKAQLTAELARARANKWDKAMAAAEKDKTLPSGILFAIVSQETDTNDVVGDGGHGRGLFQIDDRSHGDFLKKNGAAGAGGRPPVAAAALYAAALLRGNFDFGVDNGVKKDLQTKFMLSAYNAGAGGALAGLREGDSDKRTTGGDYAKSVLARYAVFQELLGTAPKPLLKKGSRGKKVEALKEQLEAWFDEHAPGTWATFKVKPGPLFGANVEKAVRDFQERVALEVDGVAGEDTQGALARNQRPQ